MVATDNESIGRDRAPRDPHGLRLMNKNRKKGFSLVEMLVVIGIISVLSGALIMGIDRVRKTAQRSKAQEIVSNTATALGIIFQKEMGWPQLLLNWSGKQLEAEPSHVFVRFNLLGLSYDSKSYNASTRKGTITLVGADRCGVVDPWATAVLKRKTSSSERDGLALKVDTGGTVQDHILWFAIDDDGDGITEVNIPGSPAIRVRASACVWSAGADGVLGKYGRRDKAADDDVYSWSRGQEVK